jgi:acyl-CoA synthetase (NDP forming)
VSVETIAQVEALLNPRNVVILGATDRPGNWAYRVWRNLRRYGYVRAIYPFNPGRDRVWDTRCYRSFAELPEPPDHLVVLIPAAAVPDALAAGARAGARSATVMTSGFDEATDHQSARLTERLKRIIAETGLGVSGPNCLGNLNGGASFVTMPDDRPQRVAAGPVAIVGQSGGIAMAIKRTLEERGTESGFVITSGNEAGLTTADYIAYFAREQSVRAIVSYLESVHDADAFIAACRAARETGKPVIVMKLGGSVWGREAALAHTGRLAGSLGVFDALAGAAGAIRVANLDAAVEAVEYVVHAPIPSGRGLGAITFSGGLRGLMLDAAAAKGLAFAALARSTREQLKRLLTVGTIVGNPLDAGFAALTSKDAYLKCVEVLLADPGIDVLLLQEELPRAPGTERKEANLAAVDAIAAVSTKPIAFTTMISHSLTDYSRILRARLPHLAFLQEVDKSMAAVCSLMDYAERLRTPATKPCAPTPARVRDRLERMLARPPARVLNEIDSKRLLRLYGMATPKEAVAKREAEAAAAAKRIGFPVVVKALGIAHKSDVGGVVLGLDSAKAVRAAYRRLMGPVARRAGAKPVGVLIAQQASGGIELVLGVHRDPEMGPVILFGAGGVEVERDPDVALAALPLDEQAALALIARTRVARSLGGWRGGRAFDRRTLVKALLGLSRLACDAGGRIESIDVNPYLLRSRGGLALDALVVLA